MKTDKSTHTPARHIRMEDALFDALGEYGRRSGIGPASAVIRFACLTLLRNDGVAPVQSKPEARAS